MKPFPKYSLQRGIIVALLGLVVVWCAGCRTLPHSPQEELQAAQEAQEAEAETRNDLNSQLSGPGGFVAMLLYYTGQIWSGFH